MLRALGAVALLLCGSSCEAGAKKLKPDTAAIVVAFSGKAQLKPAGAAPRDAANDDQLKPDDAISVPRGGFALLQLVSNGYAVRIDEELELKVNELALFGAPKTEVSFKAQVDQLLSPAEQKTVNERMTGFYATAAAAETRGASREKATEPAAAAESVHSKSEATPGSVAPGAPPKVVQNVAPPSPRPPAPVAQPQPEPKRPQKDASGGGPENKPAEPPAVEAFSGDVGGKKSSEEAVQGLAWPDPTREAALRACLAPVA